MIISVVASAWRKVFYFNFFIFFLQDVENEKDISDGSWSSINLFDVVFDDNKVTYKLMVTVVIGVKSTKTGEFECVGNLTKKYEKTMDVPDKE